MYALGLTQVQRKQSWAEVVGGNPKQGVLGNRRAAALTVLFRIGFTKISQIEISSQNNDLIFFLFLENTVPVEVHLRRVVVFFQPVTCGDKQSSCLPAFPCHHQWSTFSLFKMSREVCCAVAWLKLFRDSRRVICELQ